MRKKEKAKVWPNCKLEYKSVLRKITILFWKDENFYNFQFSIVFWNKRLLVTRKILQPFSYLSSSSSMRETFIQKWQTVSSHYEECEWKSWTFSSEIIEVKHSNRDILSPILHFSKNNILFYYMENCEQNFCLKYCCRSIKLLIFLKIKSVLNFSTGFITTFWALRIRYQSISILTINISLKIK